MPSECRLSAPAKGLAVTPRSLIALLKDPPSIRLSLKTKRKRCRMNRIRSVQYVIRAEFVAIALAVAVVFCVASNWHPAGVPTEVIKCGEPSFRRELDDGALYVDCYEPVSYEEVKHYEVIAGSCFTEGSTQFCKISD